MRPLLFVLGLTVLICSCQSAGLKQLTDIEGYIQEDHKKAYQELSEIKQDSNSTKEEKALYSLLWSMALDKNYIDVKSDSLIAPAVKYYSRHGSKQHRFLAYYYAGRVFENAGEYNDALTYYMKAEQSIDNTISKEYLVRLYTAKQRLYYRQYAYDRAIEQAQKARSISKTLENPQYYLRNTLDVALMYSIKEENSKSDLILDSLGVWITDHNVLCPSTYYSSLIRSAVGNNSDTVLIDSLYSAYEKQCKNERIQEDPLISALVNKARGDYNAVISSLSSSVPDNTFKSISYYSILYLSHKALGHYKEALENFVEYQKTVEKHTMSIFNNDTRFLEERYKNELVKERNIRRTMVLIALILVLVAVIVVVVVTGVKRKQRYDEELESARSEYEFLKEVMNSPHEGPDGVQKALESRLQALRPFIRKDQWLPSPDVVRQLRKMNEANLEMFRSVGLIYAMTYPEFVAELVKYGLSSEEIGLCAMYISDYSTKELPKTSKSGNIYLINGEIRKKLQIPANGEKLGHWLQNLFVSVYKR